MDITLICTIYFGSQAGRMRTVCTERMGGNELGQEGGRAREAVEVLQATWVRPARHSPVAKAAACSRSVRVPADHCKLAGDSVEEQHYCSSL